MCCGSWLPKRLSTNIVMPAKAGISGSRAPTLEIPAFAGMTTVILLAELLNPRENRPRRLQMRRVDHFAAQLQHPCPRIGREGIDNRAGVGDLLC